MRDALATAIAEGQPREGIDLLNKILGEKTRYWLAKALFEINAYRPLLNRCRSYMIAQVRQDTPSSSIVEIIRRGKMLRALLVFFGL